MQENYALGPAQALQIINEFQAVRHLAGSNGRIAGIGGVWISN
jgi:hypothetical protein